MQSAGACQADLPPVSFLGPGYALFVGMHVRFLRTCLCVLSPVLAAPIQPWP